MLQLPHRTSLIKIIFYESGVTYRNCEPQERELYYSMDRYLLLTVTLRLAEGNIWAPVRRVGSPSPGVNLPEPDAQYFVPHEILVSQFYSIALDILMALSFSRGEMPVTFEFTFQKLFCLSWLTY
jgi:hypothetical protein